MFDSVIVDVPATFGDEGLRVMSVQKKDVFGQRAEDGSNIQAKNKAGLLMWKIQVMAIEPRFERGETFSISVPSNENLREIFKGGMAIEFDVLRFGAYERRDSKTNAKLGGHGVYWSAEGVRIPADVTK